MAERLVTVRARLFEARTHGVLPPHEDVLEELRVCRYINYYVGAGRGPSTLTALKTGLTLADLASALGTTVEVVRAEFLRWIDSQVDHFRRTGKPGMTPAEADTARQLVDQALGGGPR
jgi:hypothetical protein